MSGLNKEIEEVEELKQEVGVEAKNEGYGTMIPELCGGQPPAYTMTATHMPSSHDGGSLKTRVDKILRHNGNKHSDPRLIAMLEREQSFTEWHDQLKPDELIRVFEKNGRLGSGYSGNVFIVLALAPQKKRLMAVKMLKADPESLHGVHQARAETMHNFHLCITEVHGKTMTKRNSNGSSQQECLLMEYYPLGTLQSAIHDNPPFR